MEIVQNRRANSDIENHILLTSMPVFGTKLAAKIKCHSKTLDRFKERKYGWWWWWWGGGGGGGHERLSVP